MLIVGNWKAYVDTAAKAKALATAAKKLAEGEHEIVIAPSAPHLGLLAGGKGKLKYAVQDLSLSTGGATTGETPTSIYADLGVSYAIVGHSERRAMGETDVVVLEKVKHALAQGMTPILCVGERTRDTDAQYLKLVRTQIGSVMEGLSAKERLSLVIAYEPVWAIGKSMLEAITHDDLAEMILYIRKVLSDYLPGKASSKVSVLYGGSVEPGDARSLASGTGVDGFLIGHASADAALFKGIVKAVS
jgi:triosephosphate isomerase (TIM)